MCYNYCNEFPIYPMEFFDDKDKLSYFIADEYADSEITEKYARFKRSEYFKENIHGVMNYIYYTIRKNNFDVIESVTILENYEMKNLGSNVDYNVYCANKYGVYPICKVIGNKIYIAKSYKSPFKAYLMFY